MLCQEFEERRRFKDGIIVIDVKSRDVSSLLLKELLTYFSDDGLNESTLNLADDSEMVAKLIEAA